MIGVVLSLLFAQVPVVIETELGRVEVELDNRRAPVTSANFLRYVDAGHYNGGIFHRTVRSGEQRERGSGKVTVPDNQPQNTVKIDVIQAGVNSQFKDKAHTPIALERTSITGLRHLDGAISMARSGLDTATSDFFICIGDQSSLDFGGARNPDGQGFAAFGRVTKGMEVVRKIQASPAEGQRLTPPVRILSIRRLSPP